MSTVERLTSWKHWHEPYDSLPPDLTGIHTLCLAEWDGRTCTRRAGHTGRHAAGTGERIVAVWSTRQCPQCGSEVTS